MSDRLQLECSNPSNHIHIVVEALNLCSQWHPHHKSMCNWHLGLHTFLQQKYSIERNSSVPVSNRTTQSFWWFSEKQLRGKFLKNYTKIFTTECNFAMLETREHFRKRCAPSRIRSNKFYKGFQNGFFVKHLWRVNFGGNITSIESKHIVKCQ